MQWVDIVLASVLGLSVVVGLVRGFVFEVLSLLGWFAAYFAAQWFAPELAPHIPVGKPGTAINHAAAFAAIFVAALLAWALGSRLLRMLIHATPLSLPDRLLGAVFGLLRGLVLLMAAATVISLTPLMKPQAWQASQGAQWLLVALDGLRPVLPPQLLQHLPASFGTVR
jgi:membrane protein required for colicin V production